MNVKPDQEKLHDALNELRKRPGFTLERLKFFDWSPVPAIFGIPEETGVERATTALELLRYLLLQGALGKVERPTQPPLKDFSLCCKFFAIAANIDLYPERGRRYEVRYPNTGVSDRQDIAVAPPHKLLDDRRDSSKVEAVVLDYLVDSLYGLDRLPGEFNAWLDQQLGLAPERPAPAPDPRSAKTTPTRNALIGAVAVLVAVGLAVVIVGLTGRSVWPGRDSTEVSGTSTSVEALSPSTQSSGETTTASTTGTQPETQDATTVVVAEPEEEEGSSTTGVERSLAPDPYLYISFNGFPPDRTQDCDGLLGLCLFQDISIAIDAFGSIQVPDYPQPHIDGESTCHRWEPRRIRRVTVCEREGQIQHIAVAMNEESDAQLAVGGDIDVLFPSSIADEARRRTEEMGPPYLMSQLDGEGFYLYSFTWEYLPPNSGFPVAEIRIAGADEFAQPDQLAAQCNYEQHLAAASAASLEIVTVQTTAFDGPQDERLRC